MKAPKSEYYKKRKPRPTKKGHNWASLSSKARNFVYAI